MNKDIGVQMFKSGVVYVRCELEKFIIYSCYISPNITLELFKKRLDAIMMDVQRVNREAIATGDFNAKSTAWGSPSSDKRGEYIEEWIATLNLVVLNQGNPTFERGESRSHIDLTLSTSGMSKYFYNWQVSEKETLSLHKYIHFEVDDKNVRKKKKTGKIFINEKLRNFYGTKLTSQNATPQKRRLICCKIYKKTRHGRITEENLEFSHIGGATKSKRPSRSAIGQRYYVLEQEKEEGKEM